VTITQKCVIIDNTSAPQWKKFYLQVKCT